MKKLRVAQKAVKASAPPHQRRAAVIDLGSNSVRLVIFEGVTRNPIVIFNEKATLKLGRGLHETGRLNEEGLKRAHTVLKRFNVIARSMKAEPFEILATAAVRDADNGAEFIEILKKHMPNVAIRILSGEEEARYSATGVLCGQPDADGIVADIGGGSLELIHVAQRKMKKASTMPLGVIRLSDRAEGERKKAAELAAKDIGGQTWLKAHRDKTLYLVGGAFRALARLQIARTQYPLNMVHLYTLRPAEAEALCDWILSTPRKALEKTPNLSKKRFDDVPYAAIVLLTLMKRLDPDKIVFSVDGLREGWYMARVGADVADIDPCDAMVKALASRLGRGCQLPDALINWTQPLFEKDDPTQKNLRKMACRLSDIGAYDHPEYRAEQTFLRILHVNGGGFDHQARGFIATALAIRYEADVEGRLLSAARDILPDEAFERATRLGKALRLAYTICGGTESLLKGARIARGGGEIVLELDKMASFALGSNVKNRLSHLGAAFGEETRIVTDA